MDDTWMTQPGLDLPVLAAPEGIQERPVRKHRDAIHLAHTRLQTHAEIALELSFLGERPQGP